MLKCLANMTSRVLSPVMILAHISLLSLFSPMNVSGEERAMVFPTSRELSQKIVEDRCNNVYHRVVILKNKEGLIGGYVIYRTPIMDSPIYYHDSNGKFIAFFHIFGSDYEKAKATKIIDPLTKEFPIREELACGKRSL